MSDETERLVEALIGAAMETGASPEDTDESVHYQRVALLAHIRAKDERIAYFEKREGMTRCPACDEWRIRAYAAERERDEARAENTTLRTAFQGR